MCSSSSKLFVSSMSNGRTSSCTAPNSSRHVRQVREEDTDADCHIDIDTDTDTDTGRDTDTHTDTDTKMRIA
jgi:hypothetical protein